MSIISVSQLKANPSRYLRLVQRGGEVQIVVRGRPVARLVGLGAMGEPSTKARRERLIQAGVIRPGKGGLRRWLEQPPLELSGVDLSGALHEERGERV